MLRFLHIVLLALTIAIPSAAMAGPMRVVNLTVHSGEQKHVFKVEVASTRAQQAKGLMGRTELADNRGMIFPQSKPQPMAMWMEKTLIPLDIIFIGPDKKIVNILTGQPNDQTVLSSAGQVIAALEIKGGMAQTLGIKPGDTVSW